MNLRIVMLLLPLATPVADPDPGSWRTYNPAVTQETIQQTTCIKGWTHTVRPPVYITNVIKKRLLEAQGMTWDQAPAFKLDHVVPLFAGGEPGDLEHQSNFQLQTNAEASRKDRLEAKIGCMICVEQITLQDGRDAFLDWRASYHRYARIKCNRPRPLQKAE